jgi:hypothetical protein
MTRFVASLTTIPSRINDHCKLAIDSLIAAQIDHIYLSVSTNYRRFGEMTVPSYLYEGVYAMKVSVVIGEDFGSATKYKGALHLLLEKHQWVFFCDDDQEYHPHIIETFRCLPLEKTCVYQNRFGIFKTYGTSGGFIHGYVGVLFHSSQLQSLVTFAFPEAARFVDDQWMSIYCFLNDLPIMPTGLEEYDDIFKVLGEHGYEKLGPDSLSELNNRNEWIDDLARTLNIQFCYDKTKILKQSENILKDLASESLN